MHRNTSFSALVSGVVFVLCASATTAGAVAQVENDTLRLRTALDLAREMNPSVRAAVLRADASFEHVAQVGALPEPVLSFGLMNRDVAGFGMGTAMAMNSVQLMQRFPWPGKLGMASDRAAHLARAQELETGEVELGLLARVTSAYVQMAYMDRALVIMKNTRSLLRDFFDVSSSMYEVGTGQQQDVLQAQVSVARMTEDITVMEQNRAAAAARLNGLVGRAVGTAIAALEFPDLGERLPAVDSLLELATTQRPAFGAANERVLAAGAAVRAASRAVYPDLIVTLGYGHRPDFSDVATVMVGLQLPLWAKSRQLPLRREMEALQSLEDAKANELYNETAARLGELRAEATRARNLVHLYQTSILPQARSAVETAFSAYRVGNVDFSTLVQSQMTVNRYSIEVVRLTAEYHRVKAGIEAEVGRIIGGRS